MGKYLSIAVAAILAANSAMAEVTIYGKANVSLQGLSEKTMDGDFKAQDNYELISNKSRLGLKGNEAINGPIKLIYQMEWEVSLDSGDTGSGQALKQRNTFVGLGGDWGSIMAGIHDTPTKMIAKPMDLFNDSRYSDIENATVGEVRHKNMLIYRSPVMSGINIDVLISPGEDKGSDSLDNATANKKRNDIANAISAALTYQLGGFKVALGLDSKVEQKLSIGSIDLGPDETVSVDDIGSKFAYEGETDLQRLVVSYDHSAFGVAGMLQHAKQSQGDVNSVTISIDTDSLAVVKSSFGKSDVESIDTAALAGYYNLGSWKLKALSMYTTLDESETQFDQLALGVDYKLGKSTTLFAYGAKVKAEDDSHFEIAANTTLGFGIDHNF
jgi:predicted porin